MSDNLWFLLSILWQVKIELKSYPSPWYDWAWGSRKFCATSPIDLLTFIFCKLHLYFIIQLCVIPLHFFASSQWSLSSSRAVFILLSVLPHTSLLQGLEGFPTGSALSGPGVRDSPAQQCMCGSFTTWWDQKWVLLPKQGRRSVWFVSWGTIAPLSCRFLFQPTWGAGSSCWEPAHLTSRTLSAQWCHPSCPTHCVICTHVHIMLQLSGQRISVVGLFL